VQNKSSTSREDGSRVGTGAVVSVCCQKDEISPARSVVEAVELNMSGMGMLTPVPVVELPARKLNADVDAKFNPELREDISVSTVLEMPKDPGEEGEPLGLSET
jgi:hypothetical protein